MQQTFSVVRVLTNFFAAAANLYLRAFSTQRYSSLKNRVGKSCAVCYRFPVLNNMVIKFSLINLVSSRGSRTRVSLEDGVNWLNLH